ncbi:MAG: ATP-dependent DNA helicase [Terriglobales bacterium]
MTSPASPATKIVPDERQQQAIGHVHGPMLVIAGAGTGKTTVLTQRVANLIREGHARPDEIVALTYTDNSAAEMLARVRGELKGTVIDGLQACTFHAWCNGLLQRRGAGFGVLDDKDLWVYLRRRIRDLRLKHFVRAANVGQFLDSLLDFMRRCQDELVGPAEYALYVKRLERGEIALPRVARSKKQTELEEAEILERCQEIARVFATVENMLREENLGTFGHMITKAYELLKNDPARLEEERGRTRFLLVDEFQDANFAQVEILSLLAGPAANVFAVGDADQAIYQFRGASSEAFTLFMRNFPAARVVALEKNRRSLSPILGCAFGIVNENPAVFGQAFGQTFSQNGISISYQRKPLASLRDEEAKRKGEITAAPLVEIVTWRDKEVEAADLARRIQRKRKDKDKDQRCRWSDFAMLYRQHNHRDELVQELAERGIPFSIEGLDVLDTPEVRDVVACLTAAVSPNDHASLFRVAALPQFGINPMELRAAMRAVRRQELDLRTVLGRLAGGAAVLESVEKIHREVKQDGVRAGDAVSAVIRHFDLQRSALMDAFVKFVDSWQTKAIAETGSPSEFLEYLDYFVQARGTIPLPRSEDDAVQLLTAHAAKGLEFQHVAIIRGSSVSFPTAYHEPLIAFPPELRRAATSSPCAVYDDKTLHEEEERRLFYVAMTRAKDTLAIYAHQGQSKKDPKPTKFLREFMVHPAYRKFWSSHPAAAVQDSLFAEEEQRIAVPQSNVAAWLLMPPSANFVTGLSASAIEIYEECPLRFKLEREWNLPRDVPASLHYGAAMHRILHSFYDAQRYGREIGDDDLIEQFRSDLASAGIADRYQYELYLRQGMEQLRQFFEWARGAEPPEVIETECRFELQVGSAKVAGRVDRIDRTGPDSVAIVDYKTGKPKSQEDADESLQLSLYALAARETWGKRADRLIFHNLENNMAVDTTRTDAELEAAKLRVQEVAEGIARGKFAAKLGYHCAFCPYRNLCPATEKTVAAPQKKSVSCVN